MYFENIYQTKITIVLSEKYFNKFVLLIVTYSLF